MLMRNMYSGLLLSAVLLAGGCASTDTGMQQETMDVKPVGLPEVMPFPYQGTLYQDHVLVGQFWSVRENKAVSWREVFGNLPKGGWILLGEAHDMRDHQGIENLFIRVIERSGKLGRVAFEQLDEDQQALVDPWLGKGDEVNSQSIGWDLNGWDWDAYIRPLGSALNAAEGVIAINPSRERIQQVYKGEHPIERADAAHDQLMAELIREGHCNMLPENAIEPMVKVQLAKDQFMARRLEEGAMEGRIGVAIMGYQHARKDYGVPLWLSENTPSQTILLQHLSDSEDPQSYIEHRYGEALPADYILFTPSDPREDYCEQLKGADFSHATE